MAGINVKMGVSGVSEFKRGIGDAESAVKALTKALDLNEAQLKATGDEERYLQNKTENLKAQIEAQTKVVQQAQAALQYMEQNGVDKASKAFQDMQAKVYSAGAKLLEMKTSLAEVESGAKGAGDSTEELNNQVGKIGKSEAWKNAAEGLGKFNDALERGARAAVNFGKKIYQYVSNSAEWADNLKTDADKFGIGVEDLQRMRIVAEYIDTEVDTIVKARQKLMTGVGKGNKATMGALEALGISYDGDAEDTFWAAGEALMQMEDEAEQAARANELFGKSWQELIPLFKAGRETYEQEMGSAEVMSEEDVNRLGEIDDELNRIQQKLDLMKNQFIADNADRIMDMLQWVIDNKDGIIAAVTGIGAAFGTLKLAETVLNLGRFIDGLGKLGILKGGAAAAAAGGSIPEATTIAGGASLAGRLAGFGGLAAIIAGFGWAADRGVNHREDVRGTEEYLAAQSAGTEELLAEYIRAQQAASMLDWDATVEEVDAAYNRINELYEQLNATEGGRNSLSAYSDWRQEQSLGNEDWVMPDNLAQMAAVLEESISGQTQSNSEVAAAISGLEGLPAATAAAVQAGMSNVTIVIGANAVDAIGSRVGKGMYNNIVNQIH